MLSKSCRDCTSHSRLEKDASAAALPRGQFCHAARRVNLQPLSTAVDEMFVDLLRHVVPVFLGVPAAILGFGNDVDLALPAVRTDRSGKSAR